MAPAASPAGPDQPGWLDPELATLTRDRFSDPGWIFERKLDGERCLAFRSGRPVRLMTRNHKDNTSTYPELTGALAAQQARDFIIDGEIVAFDGSQSRFARLQQRLGVRHPGPDLLAAVPVSFYVFDVLWAGGRDVRPLPLRQRKQILRDLLTFTGPLRFTEHTDTDGEAYFRQACASGWEGVIAKRADAPYRAGRSRDWLKFKCEAGQIVMAASPTRAGAAPGSARCCWATTTPGTSSSSPARSAPASASERWTACTRRWPTWNKTGPRSTAASCRGPACTGSSPAWSPRWASVNGPPPGNCATPGSRACETTKTPPMSSARRRRTPPGKEPHCGGRPSDAGSVTFGVLPGEVLQLSAG